MPTLLHEQLRAVARQAPEHPAMVCGTRRLSYRELDQRTDALADTLLSLEVRRGDRVGIYLNKSLECAVAIYGILKCGAAYVPLDPAAPLPRLARLIGDCGIRCLVSHDGRRQSLQGLLEAGAPLTAMVGPGSGTLPGVRTLGWEELPPARPPPVHSIAQDLAYIIYTSGSTGTPKGIMHTHHSATSFCRWAVREYGLCASDRVANHSPLHFDISIFDYFATLHAAGTTVIVPEEYTRLPASYAALLAGERVTVLFTVPFALVSLATRGVLERHDLTALRWVIFGGEPFPAAHLRTLVRKLPHARFDNMYGPAEVNGCTHYTLPAEWTGDSVPIGLVADHADALLLSADGMPLAGQGPGELAVRTPTMMEGYWGQPELTARSLYVEEPHPGFRRTFYRTGDLVSVDERGLLHFHGRADRQIKVRGYRVELDEIEHHLNQAPDVAEGATWSVVEPAGHRSIHAAVVLLEDRQAGAAPDARKRISAFLKQRLPAYAVPASLHLLDRFPRTTSDKIDRRALQQRCAGPGAPAPLPHRAESSGSARWEESPP